MIEADVAIVGGGIHGAAAALNLARRARRVVLLERDHMGRHASGASAGGIRTLLRAAPEIPLALAARDIWHRIEAEVGHNCGYRTVGQVAIAENAEVLAGFAARAARHDHEELIDGAELARLVPALGLAAPGGLVARGDGFASPFHATMAFRAAAERAGAVVHEGTPVTNLAAAAGGGWRLETPAGPVRARRVVNAAGAWGDRIAAMAGEEVPLDPFLPMMMVTAPVAQFLTPVVINVARPLSFKQMPNGTLLIGGGRPGRRDGAGYRVDFGGLKASAATVRDLFPGLAGVPIVRAWAGLEGRFDDDLPVIGPSARAKGLVHAFGFCGHGLQLAPIVGRIVADLVIEGRTDLPIAAFAADRFKAPAMATEG